jgi:hypothetical protein
VVIDAGVGSAATALMTYRVAADVLQHLLPIDAGRSPETLRPYTLRIGAHLGTATSDHNHPTTAAAAANTVSMDSALIGGREEVNGNLKRWPAVVSAVAKADTDLSALVRRSLGPVAEPTTQK